MNNAPESNPYIGPRTFTYAQRRLFFGREREARDLLARVVSERLLLFYAQSGAGKSSLLHTRLIPQLREEEGYAVLPVGRVSGELPVGVQQVENIYLFNLMTSIDQGVSDFNHLAQLSLSDFLAHLVSENGDEWHYDPTATPVVVAEASAPAPPAQRYALIIDQFEEIITGYPGRWQEREGFFRQLNQAMLDDPNLWVVLTMREDYVAALDPYATLLANKLRARFYMERMSYEAALEAVKQPAKLGGRPFYENPAGHVDIARDLVDNLRLVRVLDQERMEPGQYVEPVQLQVVCYQLWQRLQGGKMPATPSAESSTSVPLPTPLTYTYITAGDLTALAGERGMADFVNQALADFYEQALQKVLQTAQINVSERELRDWFSTKLITAEETRGLVHQGDEASGVGGLPLAAAHLLENQFLIRVESRAGGRWYELVHDRFVQPILQANRTWLQTQNNPVTVATRNWIESERDPLRLLRGALLSDAERFAKENPRSLGEEERTFLEASLKQRATEQEAARQQELAAAQLMAVEQQQRATTLRRFALGLAALVLLTLAISVFAWQQKQRADSEAQTAIEEKNRADAEALEAKEQKGKAEEQAKIAAQAQATAEALGHEAQRSAQSARASQLASQAQFAPATQPQLGLLLALEAWQVARQSSLYLPLVEQSLRDALYKPWGQPLSGHQGNVDATAISPDGRWLLGAGADHTLRRWDLTRPQIESSVVYTLASPASLLRFSPTGRWLAVAGSDKRVLLFAGTNLEAAPTLLEGHVGSVTTLLFRPDENVLLTASTGEAVEQLAPPSDLLWWDLQTPGAPPLKLSDHPIRSLSFRADGSQVAGLDRSTVLTWANIAPQAVISPTATVAGASAVTRTTAAPFERREVTALGEANAVAFSPDGRYLFSANRQQGIQRWDADTLAEPVDLLDSAEFTAVELSFSADGRWLVAQDQAGRMMIWDLVIVSRASLPLLAFSADLPDLTAFAIGGEQQWLATAHADHTMRLWSLPDNGMPAQVLAGHDGVVRSLRFSPTNNTLVTAGADPLLRLWQLDNLNADPVLMPTADRAEISSFAVAAERPWLAVGGTNQVQTWSPETPLQSAQMMDEAEGQIISLALSREGGWLAAGNDQSTTYLWPLGQGTQVPTRLTIPESNNLWVNALAFSPDNQWLATATSDGNGRLWSLTEVQLAPRLLLTPFSKNRPWMRVLAFHPAGAQIATGNDDGLVRIWALNQTENGARDTLPGHQGWIRALAFSPDGRWLASAGDDSTIQLWNALDFAVEPVSLSKHQESVRAIAFSPDSQWLASASDDGSALLWKLTASGAVTTPVLLKAGEGNVRLLAFHPNAQWLATAGDDGLVYLWQTNEAQPQPVLLRVERTPLVGLGFSGDGRFLLTASSGGLVQRWQATADDLGVLACSVVGRNFTQTEWRQYFPSRHYQRTCGDLPAHPSVIERLIGEGMALAKAGDQAGATAFFGEAVEYDPERTRQLSERAEQTVRQARSQQLLKEGKQLARQGNIRPAIASLIQALALDPTLEIDPVAEARRLAAIKPGAGLLAKLWPNGTTLRIRFLDGDPVVQRRVAEAAQEWTKYANIRFDFGNEPNAEIRISFSASGSWSYIGTDALIITPDKPTMNFGWLNTNTNEKEVKRVVLREFGHALGLINEHQNPNANIPWDKPKVYAHYREQGWNQSTVDANILRSYGSAVLAVSKEFDPDSIMSLPIANDLTIGDFEVTGWSYVLSELDKSSVAQLYPKEGEQQPGKLKARQLIAEGDALASVLDLTGAAAKFTDANANDPTLELDAEARANATAASALIEQGTELAKNLEITAATAKFQLAQSLMPTLTTESALTAEPAALAKVLATESLITQAIRRAGNGEIEAAMAAYQRLLEIAPSTPMTTLLEVKEGIVATVVAAANDLAAEGEVAQAVTLYQQALTLDPDLGIDPEPEAARLALEELLDLFASQGMTITVSHAITQTIEQALQQANASGDNGLRWALCQAPRNATSAALVLSICQQVVTAAKELTGTTIVSGTIGDDVGEFWRFVGKAGQVVSISLRANESELDAYLTLYTAEFSLVDENDDSDGSDAQLTALTLPADGLYLIHADGYAESTGDYLLSLETMGQ